MGNIRGKNIKNVSFELVKIYTDRFNGDFESNKNVVKELNVTDNKITRNKIAGYITRVVKSRR